jgi:hypothetical protein
MCQPVPTQWGSCQRALEKLDQPVPTQCGSCQRTLEKLDHQYAKKLTRATNKNVKSSSAAGKQLNAITKPTSAPADQACTQGITTACVSMTKTQQMRLKTAQPTPACTMCLLLHNSCWSQHSVSGILAI